MSWYRNAGSARYHLARDDWTRTGRAVCGARIPRPGYVASTAEEATTARSEPCKHCARKGPALAERARASSHLAAIHRRAPSAPARWLAGQGLLEGDRRLDHGCGHGADARTFDLDPWDPHWAPESPPEGTYDVILSAYVANVLHELDEGPLVNELRRLLAPGGVAWIVVRRDVREAHWTSRGTYQRPVVLDLPERRRTSGYVIYELRQEGPEPDVECSACGELFVSGAGHPTLAICGECL